MRTVRARRGCAARAAPPAAKAARGGSLHRAMVTFFVNSDAVFVKRDCLNKLKRSGLWTSTSKSEVVDVHFSTSKSTPKTRGRPRARVLPM